MWCAPSSSRNLTPEILCPQRGPFSQASMKPCGKTSNHGSQSERLHSNGLGCPGPGGTNLLDGWYKLLGDVCSDGLVLKLQLRVMLRLQRLQDSDHLPVLAGAARLFLMSEVKPKRKKNSAVWFWYVEAEQIPTLR